MAEETIQQIEGQAGQFVDVFQIISSSESLQIAFTILIIGVIVIATVYRKFSKWTKSKKFHYSRPFLAQFIRVAILPIFAIALVSSITHISKLLSYLKVQSNNVDIRSRE